MFVREKKFKETERSYLQIVQNRRVNGKVKQDVILSLGCLQTLLKTGELKRLAKSLLKYCEGDFCETSDIKEERRMHWGIPKIIDRLWQTFDFKAILKRCCKNRAIQFDINQSIKLMLADRFICPCSKLKSYENKGKYISSDSIEIQHLYRSLDLLADSKEQIEQMLFEKNLNLFNMRVDVVFYDATTLYFESEKVDVLRNFGFGKDGKFNEVQVVMGLLIDMDGRPIGFDIFPGNLYEGHTLKIAIEKLEKRFAIEKLILVADRGMLSWDNLELLVDSKYEYIISARLRKLSKPLKKEVLDIDSYTDFPTKESPPKEDEDTPKNKYKIIVSKNVFANVLGALENRNKDQVYKEISKTTKHVHDKRFVEVLRGFRHLPFTEENCCKLKLQIEHYCSRRLILTWFSKRAKRDKAKRDLLVSKAKELLKGSAESISQRGPRRYLKVSSEKITLKEEQIQEDEKWDGFYGIYTNNQELDWQVILEHYRYLWRIEESFRILKSHFETRPMFHWTPKRIVGHTVLCFVAFLFERTIEIELKQRNIACSPDKIREAVDTMQMSLLKIKDREFYLRGNINGLARELLKIFRVKMPPQIAPADQLEDKTENIL